jgi:hypothetical protein
VELLPVRLRSSAPPASTVVPGAGPSARLEILLPNGGVILAKPQADPDWLGRLILAADGPASRKHI